MPVAVSTRLSMKLSSPGIGFPPPGNATRVASGCSAFHRRIAGSSFSGTVKLT